jgi:hypothetical protein
MHIFTASRISWLHIGDSLPQHQGYGDFEAPPGDG